MLMNSIGHEKGSAPHCLTLSQSSGRITRTAWDGTYIVTNGHKKCPSDIFGGLNRSDFM